jgi:hypothetical protein
MSEILHGRNFLMRWHDPQQTILVIEILDRWTWEDAYLVIPHASKVVGAIPHEIYTIFWFKYDTARFPEGLALPKLQELITMGHAHERLVIFVTTNTVLKAFLQLADRIYKLRNYLVKYRFVSSFEQALTIIQKERQSPVR